MRQTGMLLLFFLLVISATAEAQIGKSVQVQAGTPEDKALGDIYAATDPAQKIALLDQFMAEFGQGDFALLGDQLYVSAYLAEKNYDKAFQYGEKVFALDPDNLPTAVDLVRAAQEKGDPDKLYGYGERVSAILARYKALPAPAGTPAASWEQTKADNLAKVKGDVAYVQYAMYATTQQLPDPARRAALLERFVAAFPDSSFAENAQALTAASYQQAQQYGKMLDFAQKALARDPNNIGMLLLLADYWSGKGEQLDQAEQSAKKALDLLAQAKKPEQLSDEEWQQRIALQKGLVYSSLGQIYVNRNRNAQAVEAFKQASPLLKSDAANYGRNLYRLGFTLAKMQRIPEAREVLTEAVSVDSPYRPLAQETLAKIGTGAPRTRRR